MPLSLKEKMEYDKMIEFTRRLESLKCQVNVLGFDILKELELLDPKRSKSLDNFPTNVNDVTMCRVWTLEKQVFDLRCSLNAMSRVGDDKDKNFSNLVSRVEKLEGKKNGKTNRRR